MKDNQTTQLENAVAELNKMGYSSILDAIIKQDYQIKRLDGLLQEAYKEVRRVEDNIEKLEETVQTMRRKVYRLESF